MPWICSGYEIPKCTILGYCSCQKVCSGCRASPFHKVMRSTTEDTETAKVFKGLQSMGSLKFSETNTLQMICFNQLVRLWHVTLTCYSQYVIYSLNSSLNNVQKSLQCVVALSWKLLLCTWKLQVHLFYPLYVTIFLLRIRQGSNTMCI